MYNGSLSLYCGRILQGHPAYGFNGEGSEVRDAFEEMLERTKANVNVLLATFRLLDDSSWWLSPPNLGACPDSVLEWLSRTLPFHFIAGKVDKVVEELAMTVI
jgi:GTP-binding protein EngB required for normal cell division